MKKRWTLGDTFLLLTGAAILFLGISRSFRDKPSWNEKYLPYSAPEFPADASFDQPEAFDEKAMGFRLLHRQGWKVAVSDFVAGNNGYTGMDPRSYKQLTSQIKDIGEFDFSDLTADEYSNADFGFAYHVGYLQAKHQIEEQLDQYPETEVRSKLLAGTGSNIELPIFLGLAILYLLFVAARISANLDWEPTED